MIERKDVRHLLNGNEFCNEYSDVKSMVSVVTTTPAVKKLPELKHDNEEAIRRKLYGDVVDELKILQDFAERCEQSVEQLILVGRFYDLIDKLEWRDTDGT